MSEGKCNIIWPEISDKKSVSESNHVKCLAEELEKRYKFSKYLIDPNKFRLRKVVKILAMVQLFVNNIRKKIRKRNGIGIYYCRYIGR